MSAATATGAFLPPQQPPNFKRKPVPSSISPRPPPPQIYTTQPPPSQGMQGYQLPVRTASNHSRTRTTSSSVLPNMGAVQQQQQQHQVPPSINPVSYQAYLNHNRRSPSMATVSTMQSSGMPTRKNSSSNSSLQRSTSSRSGNSATSYVALMRRQKATVWSDRAQHEDPRILAAQRAAKLRAHMEVSAASSGSRHSTSAQSSSLTGGVARKIRHGHAVKAQQYTPHAHPTSGVPLRLSAREVDESDSEDELQSRTRSFHNRTGSGRSSLGSAGGRSQSMYGLTPRYPGDRGSSGSTPPQSAAEKQPPGALSQILPQSDMRARSGTQSTMWSEGAEPTPVPGKHMGGDYFSQATNPANKGNETSGSEEQEASFGGVGNLPPSQRKDPEQEKLDLADLRRRGSVDERTMTMSGYGRLFVANPDLSD